jgi:plasmid maintenance system antidote protein VapI
MAESEMEKYPDFGTQLMRLAERRGLSHAMLTHAIGIPEEELEEVVLGGVPAQPLLRQLAPALNLHTADLFAIAQIEPPEEFVPLDPDAGQEIPQLVGVAMRLPLELMEILRQYANSLPSYTRVGFPAARGAREQYPSGFGSVLMRMLSNRNLGWTSSAKILLRLTGQRLSASTIGAIARGRKDVTPDLIEALAGILGIETDDLAAIAGIGPLGPTSGRNSVTAGMAELIWDLRRLTADQTRQVRAQAEFLIELGSGPVRGLGLR